MQMFVNDPILPTDRKTQLPVSFIQERVWRESQTAYGSAGYVSNAYHKLQGPLDRGLLQHCLDFLTTRHEILEPHSRALMGNRIAKSIRPSQ